MLWLLAAELRKLIRPLVWGTGLAIIGFCLLITWGGANNARGALASPRIPDVCARAVTAQCRQVIAHAHAAARTAAAATSLLAQPGEIGHVAAGMLASVPGLLLIALVAGGHWGGEWGSRTIRQLLARQGRRTRVLAAKWLTIWAAGVAALVCCWVVLAIAAGAIARGQLATTAITAGSMLLALLVAGIASIGRLSPASFVQAWMNFDAAGYLPTNFWSRFVSGGQQPGELAGLLGIVLTGAVVAVIARWRFSADVTV